MHFIWNVFKKKRKNRRKSKEKKKHGQRGSNEHSGHLGVISLGFHTESSVLINNIIKSDRDRDMLFQVMPCSCTQDELMRSETSATQRATLNKSLLTWPEATATIIRGNSPKPFPMIWSHLSASEVSLLPLLFVEGKYKKNLFILEEF